MREQREQGGGKEGGERGQNGGREEEGEKEWREGKRIPPLLQAPKILEGHVHPKSTTSLVPAQAVAKNQRRGV